MSVQHLSVGRPITVPAGEVEIELVDFAGAGAQVDVVHEETHVLVDAVRLSATRLVLAPPGAAVTVRAAGGAGAPFPAGAAVQVMIRVGSGPLQAQLVSPRNDVGALPQALLVRLAPRGETIEVTALKVDDAAIPPSGEEPLPELARRALYAARAIRTATAAGGGAGLVLCVDTSASMRTRSGALQCLIEIAFGIDRGMGDGGDVPVFAVTSQVRPLPQLTAGNLADYVAAVLATQPPQSGCRAGLLRDALDGVRQGRTVMVLSDELPADVDECARQWADDVAGGWRVVVIGASTELLAAPDVTGFGMCAVSPALDHDTLCDDLLGPPLLHELIRQLTAPAPTGRT